MSGAWGTVVLALSISCAMAAPPAQTGASAPQSADHPVSTVNPDKGSRNLSNKSAATVSRATLCFGASSSAECQAGLTAALSASEPVRSFRQSLGLTTYDVTPDSRPLHFYKRAYWIRRLESISKEGIPFARVPQGHGNELVIGIDRKGMLGFTFRQKSDE